MALNLNIPTQSLLDAIITAETGGEPDPFIRTRVIPEDGSTAYGPAQITGILAKDFLQNRSDLFSKEELSYLKRFVKQSEKFAKFGNEPDKKGFDPKYDYGGSGDLTSEKDRDLYFQMARKMLGYIQAKNGGDKDKTLLEWRFGANSRKTKKSDPRYFEKIDNQLTFTSPPQPIQEGEVLTAPLVDIEGEVRESIQSQLQQENVPQIGSESLLEGPSVSSSQSSGFSEEEQRMIEMLRSQMMQEEEEKEAQKEHNFSEEEMQMIKELKAGNIQAAIEPSNIDQGETEEERTIKQYG